MSQFNTILVSYWQELRGESALPSEDDLDPDALGDIWRDCFLMQFRDIDNVVHYNYSYLGEGIMELYGENGLTVELPGVASMDATHLAEQYRAVRASKELMAYEGERVLPCGRIMAYRQCLFPMSYDGKEVHSILGRLQVSFGDDMDEELAG